MQGKSRGVVLGGSADKKIGIDIASPVTNGPPCSTRAYIELEFSASKQGLYGNILLTSPSSGVGPAD